ncbi:MAG: hypothetical protein ACI4I3_00240 [Acutalibacteraceae bacterium]
MKKTVSLLLAVIFAAIAVCTFAVSAFADETTTNVGNLPDWGVTDPTTTTTKIADDTTTTTTKAADDTTTTTTKVAESTTEAAATTAGTTLADDTPVTNPEGSTAIDDGTTKAPATTRKPAVVDTVIPSTGSSVLVPAVALLALAAGTVAVIKTKKDN